MLPPFVRKYLLAALAGTPDVLDGFLKAIPDGDPFWDFRPYPERFTLREVLAHLADWEPIFLERMIRIRDEAQPDLPSYDEGQYVLENDYAHQSPQANLVRFREGRARMHAFLQGLDPESWERTGRFLMDGPANSQQTTLEAWAVEVIGHDGYHTQQVAQWRALARR